MFVEKGYSTNYATSWHLVRSGIRFAVEIGPDGKNTYKENTSYQDGAFKGLKGTLGPLTARMTDASPISSSVIAFMGCASPGDADEAILAADIVKDPNNADVQAYCTQYGIANDPTDDSVSYGLAGERLCESFNDGPAQFWDTTPPQIELLDAEVDMTAQIAAETSGKGIPAPVGDGSGPYFLQDTRDWFAVHGSGSKRSCNILMADGSVKEFVDLNGDGYLNPGFPVPEGLTDVEYINIGYRDGQVELPPAEMFNGCFLQSFISKDKFE
jgi:prepilin-type processing-associated H-X9-DG protein